MHCVTLSETCRSQGGGYVLVQYYTLLHTNISYSKKVVCVCVLLLRRAESPCVLQLKRARAHLTHHRIESAIGRQVKQYIGVRRKVLVKNLNVLTTLMYVDSNDIQLDR